MNFGIVYGISDFGLARDLGISVYEAKKYIASYFKQYPGIEAFINELVAKAKEVYTDLEDRNKTINIWQTAIDTNNLDKMYSLVWEYQGH